VRDVHLAFGHRIVYDGLDCRMRKGGIHLLLGGSGSGKSTLLRMIGGLLRPDSGEVRVAGHRLDGLSERELGEIRKLLSDGNRTRAARVREAERLSLAEQAALGGVGEEVTKLSKTLRQRQGVAGDVRVPG